jgi:hypothetical protein
MHFLDPAAITFETKPHGFLGARTADGTVYEKVKCRTLFPHTVPEAYITVAAKKDKKWEELGILARLDRLAGSQQELVRKDLEFHYFSPEILDVKKITSKYGINQWDTDTDRGHKTFFVHDSRESIIVRETGLMVITDLDKCQYHISDYRELPAKALVELEQALL